MKSALHTLACAAALVVGPSGSTPARDLTPTLGLFVGVDDYASRAWPDLRGAEHDARELRDRLAPSAELLLGSAASGRALRDALDRLHERVAASTSRPRVVIALAGHTTRLLDAAPHADEADGRDEAYCAVDALPDGRGTLRDDELVERLRALLATGAEVLFLADTCHAGGLVDELLLDREGLYAGLASREIELAAERGSSGSFSAACLRVLEHRGPTGWGKLLAQIEREFHDDEHAHGQTPVLLGATRDEAAVDALPNWVRELDQAWRVNSHAERAHTFNALRIRWRESPATTCDALSRAFALGALHPNSEHALRPALRGIRCQTPVRESTNDGCQGCASRRDW